MGRLSLVYLAQMDVLRRQRAKPSFAGAATVILDPCPELVLLAFYQRSEV